MKSELFPKIEFLPAHSSPISTTLSEIDAFERKIGVVRLNVRPKYQRGEAWEKDFKEKLVYSLVTNYPIGNFVIRRLSTDETGATSEVVDGQQRLLTIKELIRKGMQIGPEVSKQIIQENTAYFEYDIENNINTDSQRVYKKYISNNEARITLTFKELPSLIQNQILNYNLNIIDVRCSDESIAQYFRFIQNQERLRAGEIINAIPDSQAEKYLDSIENKDVFFEKINWQESRKEFDKIFYSMIGIFDGKLNLGTTDKAIIDYIVKFNGVEESIEKNIDKMVEAINSVAKMNQSVDVRFSKRLLKFFCLLSGFGFIDFSSKTEEKFLALCNVEKKLPAFNSGITENIKMQFGQEPEEEIEKYRIVFSLGRGSHSYNTIIKRIEVLAGLINAQL